MKEKFDLSLVIACYNEEPILIKNIKKVFAVLDQTDFSYEVIFVDDGSQDKTVSLIKKIVRQNPRRSLQVFYHQTNLGRGKAVADGILRAKGKVAGYIDIDLEVSADYIPRFVNAILEGFEVAIAFRVYDFTLRSLPRWFASKGYVKIRKWFLKDKLRDTEAGYKFFKRQKILPILKEIKDSGWFWDTEIMIRSSQAGLKIIEIPTVFIRDFTKKSTVKLTSDTTDYLIKILKFRQSLKQ